MVDLDGLEASKVKVIDMTDEGIEREHFADRIIGQVEDGEQLDTPWAETRDGIVALLAKRDADRDTAVGLLREVIAGCDAPIVDADEVVGLERRIRAFLARVDGPEGEWKAVRGG